MKAARLTGPKQFELFETEAPTAGDGQCLIKLEQVSVCGSDIRTEYSRLFPEEHYPARLGAPCHECAGVVVESRCEEFHKGQRVIVIPGADTSHGLVEYIASRPSRMIALPDEGDLSEWVMCQPSGTVLYSCQRMGNVLGQNVAVVGQGGIGLSFTMLAAMMGARRVIGIDLLDYRLEWAKSFGATHTINPGQQEVVQAIQDIVGGEGADVVVEATGFPDAFNLCFRLVKQLGTVVLFGIQTSDTIPLEHDLMMAKQPTIVPTVGARTPNVTAHIERMVELKTRGLVDPGRMVTHRIGFGDVQRAYDMYEQQQDEVIKVVMSL